MPEIVQWQQDEEVIARIDIEERGDIIEITFIQASLAGCSFSTLLSPPVAKELAARLNNTADEIMGNL